jgi:hypothetical protein
LFRKNVFDEGHSHIVVFLASDLVEEGAEPVLDEAVDGQNLEVLVCGDETLPLQL